MGVLASLDEQLMPELEVPEWSDGEFEQLTSPTAHKMAAGTRLDDSMGASSTGQKPAVKTSKGKIKGKADTAEEDIGKVTQKEVVMFKTRNKKEQKLEVTGEADFLTLGLTRSADVVCNASWVTHGRLMTFQ